MGILGRQPRIYADGDRVFMQWGDRVIEASGLLVSRVEQGFDYRSVRTTVTLEFFDTRFYLDKQLPDIPKELAGTLSVVELFGVIEKKLTERENET